MAARLATASPLNPRISTSKRSVAVSVLLVAWRSSASARSSFAIPHPHLHLPEPGENLAFRKVPVANHPLPSVGQLLLGERQQVRLELRRDRGLDQPPHAGPQKLRQGVANPCWRRQRNHRIVAHVRCAPLAETVTFTTRSQQRHAARLNSSRHHFRPYLAGDPGRRYRMNLCRTLETGDAVARPDGAPEMRRRTPPSSSPIEYLAPSRMGARRSPASSPNEPRVAFRRRAIGSA